MRARGIGIDDLAVVGKSRWAQLLSLNWFKQHQHVLLLGPTGIGKSYLACALARAVIDHKQSVRYLRLPGVGDEPLVEDPEPDRLFGAR